VINEEEVLRNAKKRAQEWLDAFRLDGECDVDGIVRELSKITYKGKPCLACVVTSVEDCAKAFILCVSLFDKTGNVKEAARALSPDRYIWDYYSMAFYDCACQALPRNDVEFMCHSLHEAFRLGLGYVINLGPLLIGVTRPEAHVDDNSMVHRDDGPAIIWGDKERFFWHGLEVPGEWINKRDSLSKEVFSSIENLELKRAFCEIVGWELLADMVGFKKIQSDDFGDLIEADLEDDEGKMARFADVRCPSTGRRYLIRTDPGIETCREALARSATIKADDYEFTYES